MRNDRHFFEAREIGVRTWIDSFQYDEQSRFRPNRQEAATITSMIISMPNGPATPTLLNISSIGKEIGHSTIGAEWTVGKTTMRRTLMTFHGLFISSLSISGNTVVFGVTFEKVDINSSGF